MLYSTFGDAQPIIYQSDKAYWSDINTNVFGVLTVEHKRAGYTSNGTMTTRGYQLISIKYEE
jgi:hypothetical protein